jgi:hypothetical protein
VNQGQNLLEELWIQGELDKSEMEIEAPIRLPPRAVVSRVVYGLPQN